MMSLDFSLPELEFQAEKRIKVITASPESIIAEVKDAYAKLSENWEYVDVSSFYPIMGDTLQYTVTLTAGNLV